MHTRGDPLPRHRFPSETHKGWDHRVESLRSWAESCGSRCCLRMPAELVGVDAFLDDPVPFDPFRPCFDPEGCRRTIPTVSSYSCSGGRSAGFRALTSIATRRSRSPAV